MPHVINGIGTWYWGKRNLITRNGRCEFCGRDVELKSYDTTLYFVVVFVPLVPIGRKRILNECPRCKKHRVTSLSKWEQMRSDAILKATQDWQGDKANPQKASALIGTTIAFQDLDAFRAAGPMVAAAFPANGDVQLALAGASDHFGDMAEAESAYQKAASIGADDRGRNELAKFLIRRQRPADAEALLADALSARRREIAPLLLALVQSYQSIGENDHAHRLVEEIGSAFPDLLSDPNYDRIRKSASKYAGTSKRIKIAGMDDKQHGARRTNFLTRNSALALISIIIVIAGIWYLGLSWSLGTHDVEVINGTDRAYAVTLNGRRLMLPAHGHNALRLDEGAIRVAPADPDPPIEPATVELHTDFWTRPFHRKTFVINPDRLAVVAWEETEYAARGTASNGTRPHLLRANGVMYDFAKVDYLFEPFPQSLTLDSDSAHIKRTRLTMLDNLQPHTRAEIIQDELGAAQAAAWARRYATATRDSLDGVALLQQYLDPDAQIAFLRPHLDDRPVRIEWHRLYQTLMQTRQPSYDLVAEYRKRLSTAQADSTLQYLLARVLEDRTEANALFVRSAGGSPPCAYADFALAYDSMSQGQFDKALEQTRHGRSIDPKHFGLRLLEVSALDATGQIEPAVQKLREMETSGEDDFNCYAMEVALLGSRHDLGNAQLRIMAYAKELGDLGAENDVVDLMRQWLESDLQYAAGDLDAYARTIASIKSETAQARSAIAQRHFDEAWKTISKKKPDLSLDLTVYIGASASHDQATSAAAWSAAMATLRTGSRSARALATAMASAQQPPAPGALDAWTAEPIDRSLMLTALGLRYPAHKADYFAMARRLNFGHLFPCRLIEQVTAAPN